MKALIALLALCSIVTLPIHGQEKQRRLSSEELGWAKANAQQAYLARGGGKILKGSSSKPAFRYTEGPIKGLTTEQAIAKFNELWAQTSTPVKAKWAAMGAPVDQKKPSASGEAADKAEATRREQERKLRKLKEEVEQMKREEELRRLRN